MFNLEQMGKSQMSIKEPIKLSTTFLVLFNQLFNSLRSSWQLFPWGKGSMGSRQSWQGFQTLTPRLPKGDLSPNYPHVKEGSRILHSQR